MLLTAFCLFVSACSLVSDGFFAFSVAPSSFFSPWHRALRVSVRLARVLMFLPVRCSDLCELMEERKKSPLFWFVLLFEADCSFCSPPPVFHHRCYSHDPGRYLLLFITKDKVRDLGMRLTLQKVNQGQREGDFSLYKSVWTAEIDCGSCVKNHWRGVNF